MPLTSVELVDKVTNLIVTLSSGILTILVTVYGWLFDYFTVQPALVKWGIFVSAVFLLLSIVFGVAEYGTLVSAVNETKSRSGNVDVYKGHISTVAKFQWVLFLVGIVGLVATLYFLMMPV